MSIFRSFRKQPQKLKLQVTFVVERDGDRFQAYCPTLKGLHADGDTEQEAAENFAAAVPAYIVSLAKHGDPLPIGPELSVERHEEIPEIPAGAFPRHVTLQWPSQETSGIS